ncbi:hypothetical protein PLICRDRAFT_171391 [Plicaturopsis crispa FD-325 SS-3]|nr:hypothetical protein PLICRDRAFT_171391 [Plicaturopsis crispa FD-325 SS-3]
MSSRQQTGYPHRQPSTHLSEYPSQQRPEEFKASYDDLIDQHASPYDRNSRHQTFALDTGSPSQHRRMNSIPLSKPSYSKELDAKGIDEESEESIPTAVYPPIPSEPVDTRTVWQKLLPDSVACRFYVLTIVVETAIDLAIEADLFIRFNEAAEAGQISDQISGRKMPVYLSIFALAHVFQFGMAVDAVYTRNTLQFLCLTMFNALFLVYAVIQIFEIRDSLLTTTGEVSQGISHIPIDVLTTIIPIVIAVAQLVYMGLGWKIYHEFGWKVYKFLGADRRIKKMYANYQIFECLVKFDVFFWIGFSVQFIWIVLQSDNWEYYVTCAALPLSIVLLIEGHLAARHENTVMMVTFMTGCLGAFVYFAYKLVKVLIFRNTTQFQSVYKSLATFSVIAIVLLVATFVFGVCVMRKFGQGLKTQLTKNKKAAQHGRWKSTGAGAMPQHNRAMSLNPNRMSID